MKEEVKQKAVSLVKAIGYAIADNAESIVGDFEYGQGIKINCEIDVEMYPTIKAERQFFSREMIDVLTNKQSLR